MNAAGNGELRTANITMRYNIIHRTTYTYESPVTVGHYTARLEPRALPQQECPWHELHSTWRFMSASVPPSSSGKTWSTWASLPQQTSSHVLHVNASRTRMR
jgi:hypothetical protein